MEYQREIEKKFVILGMTYNEASYILYDTLEMTPECAGTSVDEFWKSEGVDFIRLRYNSKELTVKVSDKGNTQDRIEENVVIDQKSLDSCKRLLRLVIGPSILSLTKTFDVLKDNECVISLYRVLGDRKNRVFLEVEAKSMDKVDLTLNELRVYFNLEQERRSLFQIFNEERNEA